MKRNRRRPFALRTPAMVTSGKGLTISDRQVERVGDYCFRRDQQNRENWLPEVKKVGGLMTGASAELISFLPLDHCLFTTSSGCNPWHWKTDEWLCRWKLAISVNSQERVQTVETKGGRSVEIPPSIEVELRLISWRQSASLSVFLIKIVSPAVMKTTVLFHY